MFDELSYDGSNRFVSRQSETERERCDAAAAPESAVVSAPACAATDAKSGVPRNSRRAACNVRSQHVSAS
eukprot:5919531-Pleurochrysis_carterae.AAC.5